MTMAGLTPFVPSISEEFTQNASEEFTQLSSFKGKNKVGFNLLLWGSSISEKMNPIADRLKQIGFDGVEVPMSNPDEKAYQAFGKHLKSIGLAATCSTGLGPNEDPISESPAVRQKAVEQLKWYVDRANDVDSKIICGPTHSAFLNFRKRFPNEDEYKWSAEVLHKAGEYAAKSGVTFAVEAINRFECYLCNTTDQLNKLIKMTGHDNIRPMYDTFHSNIEDKNPLAAIASLKGSLVHVHISENDRGAPGEGHINFEAAFAALSKINYKGWITIESFSRNDDGFANAMNIWRKFSEDWDVATKGIALIKKYQSKYNL